MPKPLICALIVGACVALDIALHAATAGFLPLPADFEGSVLVRRLGFGPVALAWAIIAFSGMALVFLAIERRMTGSGFGKGLRYGIGLGLVVQVAMIEGVAMSGNSFVDEFVVGLSDAVPVVVMGALLGRFLASEVPPAQVGGSVPGNIAVTLTIFALVFGTGRVGVQLAGLVDSALAIRPGTTIIWTVAMGATIGLFHRLVGDRLRALAAVPRALAFGLGVFGVNWALFMVFVALIFPDALSDVVLRVGIDVALVTLAGLLVAALRPARADSPGTS
jgi:hypothetical protein